MKETLLLVSMRILAYCLMPNHWHFVLWPVLDDELSVFCTGTILVLSAWACGRYRDRMTGSLHCDICPTESGKRTLPYLSCAVHREKCTTPLPSAMAGKLIRVPVTLAIIGWLTFVVGVVIEGPTWAKLALLSAARGLP